MTEDELLQIIKTAADENSEELNLSRKGLTVLPSEISQLTNLKSLFLSYTQLISLPSEIDQLTSLKSLSLRDTQLSSLPPEIGQLTSLQSLDLRDTQLSSLPPEIGQLTSLQSLDLRDTQLSNLPPEIGRLTSLYKLDLSDTQLSSLPPEIGQLTNLKSLSLRYTQLSSLPLEIRRLTRLQSLDLRDTQLSSLSLEIGQLTNLKSLSLRYTQLNSLPPEIGQLTKLKSLSLRDTKLSSLPPEIGKLTSLQSLDLSHTQLSNLPPEIGRLTSLQSLDLSHTRLSNLPSEIGRLTSLQSLNLSYTQLSSLPPEIGQFTNLQSLNLSYTQLSNLPPEIGWLTSLQSLDLLNTPISSLPPEIGKLTSLKLLSLIDNSSQLENPPPEVVKKGTQAILNYFRQQLEQGRAQLYEAKFLVVGEGEAGKTSLVKKIEDNNYILNIQEASTDGIDVIRWDFQLPDAKPFRLNIWDFGGQEIYHATHQFFLTKRSLYALVVDTRKDNADLDYWLNIIDLLSNSSPILIIKNEKQDRICQIDERTLRGEFLNLKEVLATNLATNRGLPEILAMIQRYASQLEHVGTPLPKKWVNVRRTLETDDRNYISLEEYFKICEANDFQQRRDQLQLSDYLHDLGVYLHFQNDPLLRKVIILKPEWGTDAVYKVLDTTEVINNQGCFSRAQLNKIWQDSQYDDIRDELLQLMLRFKLCYEIPNRPSTYIAPNLLSIEKPDYIWDENQNLILHYDYDFMPKGILTRFIVEMHLWIEQQTLVWKSGVVLAKDSSRAEVIEYYSQRKIEIRLSGQRKKELLSVITHEFDKIHKSYERLKYKTLVPCNCLNCGGSQTPQLYPLDVLRRFLGQRQPIQCQKSFAMVDVRLLIDDTFGTQSELSRSTKPLQRELDLQREQVLIRSMSPAVEPVKRDRIFISYSHQDTEWLTKLQTFLKPMVRKGVISTWDDTQIEPGADWRKDIETAFAAAKVAVLLVSQDFLASDFIHNNELPPLLDAAENQGLTIIWVPISYSTYEDSVIEKYQAAHPPNQPLKSLPPAVQDQALVNICKAIKNAANN
ncbi:MAG: COR domain-containing protein [Cyanobacteria bacterium J06635_15]